MLVNNIYVRLSYMFSCFLTSCLAYADGIDVDGGTDHAKDFEVVNSMGKTTQSIIFNVGSKTAGSICGFLAILFLAKRRYGLCTIFAICSIAFFASKTLVTNLSNFST